jgi:hypothetical protein
VTPRGLPHHMTQAECDRLKRLRLVHSLEICAAIIGRCPEAVRRCEKRGYRAYVSPRRRPRPSDFALFAATMTIAELARHYRAGCLTVRRWAGEIGRKNKSTGRSRFLPIPDDLADVLARLGPTEAAAHYGVNTCTLQKWRERAGLPIAFKRKTRARRASTIGWAERRYQAPPAQSVGGCGAEGDRYAAERRIPSCSTKETARV